MCGEFRRTVQRAPAAAASSSRSRLRRGRNSAHANSASDAASLAIVGLCAVIFETTAYRSALSTIFLRPSATVGIAACTMSGPPSQVDTRVSDAPRRGLQSLGARNGDRGPRDLTTAASAMTAPQPISHLRFMLAGSGPVPANGCAPDDTLGVEPHHPPLGATPAPRISLLSSTAMKSTVAGGRGITPPPGTEFHSSSKRCGQTLRPNVAWPITWLFNDPRSEL